MGLKSLLLLQFVVKDLIIVLFQMAPICFLAVLAALALQLLHDGIWTLGPHTLASLRIAYERQLNGCTD